MDLNTTKCYQHSLNGSQNIEYMWKQSQNKTDYNKSRMDYKYNIQNIKQRCQTTGSTGNQVISPLLSMETSFYQQNNNLDSKIQAFYRTDQNFGKKSQKNQKSDKVKSQSSYIHKRVQTENFNRTNNNYFSPRSQNQVNQFIQQNHFVSKNVQCYKNQQKTLDEQVKTSYISLQNLKQNTNKNIMNQSQKLEQNNYNNNDDSKISDILISQKFNQQKIPQNLSKSQFQKQIQLNNIINNSKINVQDKQVYMQTQDLSQTDSDLGKIKFITQITNQDNQDSNYYNNIVNKKQLQQKSKEQKNNKNKNIELQIQSQKSSTSQNFHNQAISTSTSTKNQTFFQTPFFMSSSNQSNKSQDIAKNYLNLSVKDSIVSQEETKNLEMQKQSNFQSFTKNDFSTYQKKKKQQYFSQSVQSSPKYSQQNNSPKQNQVQLQDKQNFNKTIGKKQKQILDMVSYLKNPRKKKIIKQDQFYRVQSINKHDQLELERSEKLKQIYTAQQQYLMSKYGKLSFKDQYLFKQNKKAQKNKKTMNITSKTDKKENQVSLTVDLQQFLNSKDDEDSSSEDEKMQNNKENIRKKQKTNQQMDKIIQQQQDKIDLEKNKNNQKDNKNIQNNNNDVNNNNTNNGQKKIILNQDSDIKKAQQQVKQKKIFQCYSPKRAKKKNINNYYPSVCNIQSQTLINYIPETQNNDDSMQQIPDEGDSSTSNNSIEFQGKKSTINTNNETYNKVQNEMKMNKKIHNKQFKDMSNLVNKNNFLSLSQIQGKKRLAQFLNQKKVAEAQDMHKKTEVMGFQQKLLQIMQDIENQEKNKKQNNNNKNKRGGRGRNQVFGGLGSKIFKKKIDSKSSLSSSSNRESIRCSIMSQIKSRVSFRESIDRKSFEQSNIIKFQNTSILQGKASQNNINLNSEQYQTNFIEPSQKKKGLANFLNSKKEDKKNKGNSLLLVPSNEQKNKQEQKLNEEKSSIVLSLAIPQSNKNSLKKNSIKINIPKPSISINNPSINLISINEEQQISGNSLNSLEKLSNSQQKFGNDMSPKKSNKNLLPQQSITSLRLIQQSFNEMEIIEEQEDKEEIGKFSLKIEEVDEDEGNNSSSSSSNSIALNSPSKHNSRGSIFHNIMSNQQPKQLTLQSIADLDKNNNSLLKIPAQNKAINNRRLTPRQSQLNNGCELLNNIQQNKNQKVRKEPQYLQTLQVAQNSKNQNLRAVSIMQDQQQKSIAQFDEEFSESDQDSDEQDNNDINEEDDEDDDDDESDGIEMVEMKKHIGPYKSDQTFKIEFPFFFKHFISNLKKSKKFLKVFLPFQHISSKKVVHYFQQYIKYVLMGEKVSENVDDDLNDILENEVENTELKCIENPEQIFLSFKIPRDIFKVFMVIFGQTLQENGYAQFQVDSYIKQLLAKKNILLEGKLVDEIGSGIGLTRLFQRFVKCFKIIYEHNPKINCLNIDNYYKEMKIQLYFMLNQNIDFQGRQKLKLVQQHLDFNYEDFYIIKHMMYKQLREENINFDTSMKFIEQVEKYRYYIENQEFLNHFLFDDTMKESFKQDLIWRLGVNLYYQDVFGRDFYIRKNFVISIVDNIIYRSQSKYIAEVFIKELKLDRQGLQNLEMELGKTLDKFEFTYILKKEIFIKLRKLFVKAEIEPNVLQIMGGDTVICKMVKQMSEVIVKHGILLKQLKSYPDEYTNIILQNGANQETVELLDMVKFQILTFLTKYDVYGVQDVKAAIQTYQISYHHVIIWRHSLQYILEELKFQEQQINEFQKAIWSQFQDLFDEELAEIDMSKNLFLQILHNQ